MRRARSKGSKGNEVALDDDDVEAIRRARASIQEGRKVPMELLFKLLDA